MCIHFFFTSALVGGKWLASYPNRFIPGERDPDSHWIGGLVDPSAGLDDVEKIIDPTGTRTPSIPSVVQFVASRFTGYAIPAHPLKL
jgi:hypothetical protein